MKKLLVLLVTILLCNIGFARDTSIWGDKVGYKFVYNDIDPSITTGNGVLKSIVFQGAAAGAYCAVMNAVGWNKQNASDTTGLLNEIDLSLVLFDPSVDTANGTCVIDCKDTPFSNLFIWNSSTNNKITLVWEKD